MIQLASAQKCGWSPVGDQAFITFAPTERPAGRVGVGRIIERPLALAAEQMAHRPIDADIGPGRPTSGGPSERMPPPQLSLTYRWLYDLLRPHGSILLAHPLRLRAMP